MKLLHLKIVLLIYLGLAGCSLSQSSMVTSSDNGASDNAVSAETLAPAEKFRSAEMLAWDAAVIVQHPPHLADTWQSARVKWRQAIRLLESISGKTPLAAQANAKLAIYRKNYAAISQRLVAEQTAKDQLGKAQTLAWQAAVTVQNPPHSLKVWQRASQKWAAAIALLATVPPKTSVTETSRSKLVTYRNNFSVVARRLQTERAAERAVQQFAKFTSTLVSLQTQAEMGTTRYPLGIDYSNYRQTVQALKGALTRFEQEPEAIRHPVYQPLSAAIADYDFVQSVWDSYLKHKQANISWLNNQDFYNLLIPLTLIDSATLLQKYKVKIYQASGVPKVSLKLTAWEIWEQAGRHVDVAQQRVSTQVDEASVQSFHSMF
ncbi:hypothetical protein JOY44_15260 [Phormidium sp. CLA17]|uniref:hypothetical protein n=1 Tax=Leptolyngbya sp. Cla-17 TaxID=2803751 RepID=UPI001490C87B|nr:hypothetical protein [Leptolyngbya sp. Cla-17]MBM0742947.1 hypothetical protein [Leptolyngbya sp. Cla-17]